MMWRLPRAGEQAPGGSLALPRSRHLCVPSPSSHVHLSSEVLCSFPGGAGIPARPDLSCMPSSCHVAGCSPLLQVIFLATVALLVSSLATVAVPKLAGNLIDVCINYAPSGESAQEAKQELNKMLFQIIAILAVGGIASGLRAW